MHRISNSFKNNFNKHILLKMSVKSAIKILLILYGIVLTNIVKAQQLIDSTTTIIIADSIIQKKTAEVEYDAKDFFKALFKGSHQLVKDSSSNNSSSTLPQKKVFVTLLPAVGYTLQTSFAATVSAGFAFYVDTAVTKKLSEIITSLTYTHYNQFLFPIYANIWTKQNKFNLILDYRFLRYPSTTYGLGAHSTENDAYSLNFNYIKLHQTVLKKIYKELYGGIGFYYDYFWNVTEIDPPSGIKTSFQKYGGTQTMKAAGFALKLLYDSRQNQINPFNGTFANIIFRPNYTFLGSDNNWKSLLLEFKKYFKLNEHTKNVLALWSYNWLTLGKDKPPYLLLPSTGWDDLYNTGRGYVQSRFRAKNMIYAEAEYRFSILNNGLLGGVVFANAQSFSKNFSNQLAVISPGLGAGVRIKLNKYSKTNLCIDYGFGLNGSKGLFLNLGEVF